MNSSIRKVALVLGLIFVALFANLNYVQLARSRDLSNDNRNRRQLIEEYGTRRGEIIAAGNVVIARSIPSQGGQYKYRREYPLKNLFGHITGYYSFYYGRAGLEGSFDDYLLGKEPVQPSDLVDELLGRERAGNILQLTIDPELQKLAESKLRGQRGAAALIDAETGGVMALYANPTYDPNPLAQSPSRESEIRRAWSALTRNPLQPLTFRAAQERYAPGSTFKIVTAAAGLENGMRPGTTFANPRVLDLPDTNRVLGNFSGGACSGGGRISITRGFHVSCNTTFAQVAMRVGPAKLSAMADKFGLNRAPDFDIPIVPSCVRSIAGFGCDDPDLSRPATAYSGIGQQDVRVTPLQMALIAATVGNGGYVPRPYLVAKVLDPNGKVIRTTKPERSKRIYSARTAREMRRLMIGVVTSGTGRVVRFKDGRKGIIGGKTGTAQIGIEGVPPHVWFVAFGPKVAVAVVVENGGVLRDLATGGKVAGPIAKALLEAGMVKRK